MREEDHIVPNTEREHLPKLCVCVCVSACVHECVCTHVCVCVYVCASVCKVINRAQERRRVGGKRQTRRPFHGQLGLHKSDQLLFSSESQTHFCHQIRD